MSVITFLEYMAVIVSASYGVLLATRTGMDFVGAFAVAFAAAFGGGTLRDLFLDRTPLFWIGNPNFVVAVLCVCLISAFFAKLLPRIKPLLIYPDAVGVALFTTVGTAIALDYQESWLIAAILGTITGTFGGVLADIICNEVPNLFKASPFCATCSFVGAYLYIFGHQAGLDETFLLIGSTAFIVAFRLLAVWRDWRYPALRSPS